MPATRSHASRSPGLERVAPLVMALAFATVAGSAVPTTDELDEAFADAGDVAGAPQASRARRPQVLPPLPPGEIVVIVKVNGEDVGEAIVYQDLERGLMAERADLSAWRVATPDAIELREGVEYVALGMVPGLRHSFERRTGVLAIALDASQFVIEERALYDLAVPQVAAIGFGAFLNYDFEHRVTDADSETSGFAQLGLFAGPGVLTSDWALADEATRLNTTYTRDSLSRIATLRVGDFVGVNSTISGGVPIGGVQWATNFATRPGLMPIPLQRFRGEVSVPSTVEIYVNGVPTYRTQVAPGPFVITDVPVVTGGGTVEMVITDGFGRRQVVSNPFYASPSVLRAGLSEYSFELGARRVTAASGVALEYDEPVARVVHRSGLTDAFTAEVQAEGAEGAALVGSALAWLVPGGAGVMRFALASSQAPDGSTGALALLGYELALNNFSFTAEGQHNTPGFARIGGLAPDPVHSRDLAQMSVGFNNASIGSIALAVARERNLGPTDSTTTTVTWSRGLGPHLNLSASAGYDYESRNANGFVNFSVPLGARTNASFGHNAERPASGPTTSQSTANLQRNLDTGPSWGYRLGAAQAGDAVAEFAAQGERATMRVGAERVGSAEGAYATLGGAIALVDGSLHASRRLGDGFALIRVPGAPSVGVYSDNAYIGKTDAEGERLVPSMTPYRPTRVTLDASDLPLEVQLKTDRMEVTVPYRAAAVLEFPSDLTRAYTANLVRKDGAPVPAGAKLWIDDGTDAEPIGSGGFVFLSVDPGPHRLTVRWVEKECSVGLTIEPSDDPQPDLGRLVCLETRP